MIACTKEKRREGGSERGEWFSDQEQMDRGICEELQGYFAL